MKLLARILALFIVVPIVELYLLIQFEELADAFTGGHGLLVTLLLILATGTLGSVLAKREGLEVWRRLHLRIQSGQMPGKELLDGVIILMSGALLITPGVLSDMLGILGLFPPTRALVRRYVMRRLKRSVEKKTLSFGFGSMSYPEAPDASSRPAASDAPPSAADEHASDWQGEPKRRPGDHTSGRDA